MQYGNMLTSQTHAMQDEALRPFVAVLRHAENALVREMTVQVVSQAIATNPKGLGSGALPFTGTLPCASFYKLTCHVSEVYIWLPETYQCTFVSC